MPRGPDRVQAATSLARPVAPFVNHPRQGSHMAHATRALVVDDESLIRWALGQALADHGCQVTEAASAAEARAVLRTASFDVVVMDYRLPDTTELELLRHVRRALPQSRVVMMTSHRTSEMVDQARHLGVATVLEKPLDLDVACGAILQE